MSEQLWVTLARIVRPQGRKGEVLADLLTDFPDRFRDTPSVFLRRPQGEPEPTEVESYWLPTGRSAGRVVLKLRGSDSISDAEQLLAAEIQVPSDQRLSLADGSYYVSDLLGCQLMQDGIVVGTVADMHFPQDPSGKRIEEAPALFVLEREDGDEVMVPFASAFVKSIDVAEKRIEMELPDGLLDVNAAKAPTDSRA